MLSWCILQRPVYKTQLISTIVDTYADYTPDDNVYKTQLISTIVDLEMLVGNLGRSIRLN